MKIFAEQTEIIVELDGVPCRVWNGVTEGDDQIYLFVHRVMSRSDMEELAKAPAPVSLERIV